ncbi:MAG: diacylglycerol kinase [Gammaproteobacteria bacterium]
MSDQHNKPPLLPVIPRLWRAFHWSLKGLEAAFRYEQSFRIELAGLPLVIILACWLGETYWQWALLISGWLLLLMCELLNSAVEVVVDRISNEEHELSGRAKDLGSAAVFVVISINLLMWLALLLDSFAH